MEEPASAYESFKSLAESAGGPIGRRLANQMLAASDGANGLNTATAIAALATAIIQLDTVVAAATNYEMR